jgi:phosphoglucomutase
VAYWRPIVERYGVEVEVVNETVDPTFAFMTLDWDGKIRMDCSSPHAMAKLIALKDRFDIAFGNDTDHDRHWRTQGCHRAGLVRRASIRHGRGLQALRGKLSRQRAPAAH